MKVRFERTEDAAQNIKTFWFKPEKEIRHVPGQFIELRIPHANKDVRGDRHWFSLSSSPTEDLISISTKVVEEHGSSFKSALQKLRPGEELHMADPMGDFVLPKDADIPLIFVAGGIGCTPYRSIIKYLADKGETRDITFLYAASTIEEVAFKDVFGHLKNKFHIILSKPKAGWKGMTGRLDAKLILNKVSDKERQRIYLSGPEPMVEGIIKDLKSKGFNKKHLLGDYFPGYK